MPSTAVARSAASTRARPASCSASGSVWNSSGCRSQGTIVGPRRSRLRPCETANAETAHPTRRCSSGLMATSTMVPSSTSRPYSSEARISPVRRVKRSRSMAPPSRWAPSMEMLGDLAEVDEDAAPLQCHHKPQRARRLIPDGGQDHDVADPADGQALAVQQRTAVQPGGENLAVGHSPGTPPSAGPICTIIVPAARTQRIDNRSQPEYFDSTSGEVACGDFVGYWVSSCWRRRSVAALCLESTCLKPLSMRLI